MSTESLFPKGVINKVCGRCIALRGDDIDTDRIIPARFLKCVSFQNLGGKVFADDRIQLKGDHPFDIPDNQGASILVVNDNFGCGSSREHAPQALMRWGIRAVVAQSLAEIFYGNCLALGIPCATASRDEINNLQKIIRNNSKQLFELNLQKQSIIYGSKKLAIRIESGPLKMLTTGQWDATSQLIKHKDELNKTMRIIPYLNGFDCN